MIHRFLIFDRKFNCRIDRRYPLNQFVAFNDILNKSVPAVKVNNNDTEGIENKGDLQQNDSTWNTLIIKDDFESEIGSSLSPSATSLTTQLNDLGISEPQRQASEIVEHSQQLILGLTHSLKNILMKLSPTINQQSTSVTDGPEGYSFSFKTSKYRLYYFESFTGWKLVMITDCNQPTANVPTNLTSETVLKTFYTQILLKFLLTYPLGTIYTAEKSTESHKVVVENDFLHRAGFLSKMDEFIQNIDKIF